jgi:hypothetical protein
MPYKLTKCSVCGIEIKRYYSKTHIHKLNFCSSTCAGSYYSKNEKLLLIKSTCEYCGKEGTATYKKTFCGTKCYNNFMKKKWKWYYPNTDYKKIKYKTGDGNIYFFTTENSNGVKIGYSKDVDKRAKGMQSDHYDKVIVLLVLSGATREDENKFHDKFKEHRIQGEWYSYCPEILNFIKKPHRL